MAADAIGYRGIKTLESYDPEELLVAARLRELTREGSPFLDVLRTHNPEKVIALLKITDWLQGEHREELLDLLQKYSAEGVVALIQLREMLNCDPTLMPKLLELMKIYSLDELVRTAEAKERYREQQRSRRSEKCEGIAEKKAAYMRSWRAKKKKEKEGKS
jgi:hypothetical protein